MMGILDSVLPTRNAMKNKIVTALCMMLILISLYMTCYMLFFRTIEVDITSDVTIEYRGESKSASVVVKNKNVNYNQRIQEFMDSISYKATPDHKLKNGDKIKITAKYDKALASRYHIEVINETREVIVENLPVRFGSVKEIEQSLIDAINQNSDKFMQKTMDTILNEDFTDFYMDSEPELIENTRMYRVFLNAKEDTSKDKIVDVYAIRARGEVNTVANGKALKEKESTIYYMITYNEINTSQKILSENIYGEKVITKESLDLSKEKDFMTYMQLKYGKNYTIEIMKK